MGIARHFILVGDKDTWTKSILHDIWGFSEKSIGNWNTSNIGDYVAFYVTSPIKKIIGHGVITSKFVSDEIMFPDEITFGRSIWKYRIRFKKLSVLENWDKGISVPQDIMLNTGRKVVDEELFLQMVSQL